MTDRRHWRGDHGFTLVELLVVVVILGILAGVVVFAVGNSTSNAGAAACRTEAHGFQHAVIGAQAEKPPIALTGGDAVANAATLRTANLLNSATLTYLDDSQSGTYPTGWTYSSRQTNADTCA